MFRQPQMDWQIEDEYRQNGFNEAVKRIAQIRRANPRFDLPTDLPTIAVELENYTVERLRSVPGGDQWVTPGEAPPLPFQKRLRTEGFAGGVAAVKEFAQSSVAGIGLWLEWFSTSGPVESALAEARATTCSICPLNQPATGLNSLSELAGKELAQLLGSLRQKKLSTKHDAKLGVCTACLCPLQAKVFAPLDLAMKHMRPEAHAKFDKSCWLLSESKSA